MTKTNISQFVPVYEKNPVNNTSNSISNSQKQNGVNFSKTLKAEVNKLEQSAAVNKSNFANNGTNLANKEINEPLMKIAEQFVQQFMTFYFQSMAKASGTTQDQAPEVQFWQEKRIEAMVSTTNRKDNITGGLVKDVYEQLIRTQRVENEK